MVISTEKDKAKMLRMVALLWEHVIAGWRRYLKLPDRPDLAVLRHKLALFTARASGADVCSATGFRKSTSRDVQRSIQ
jgi:hypothetical protein